MNGHMPDRRRRSMVIGQPLTDLGDAESFLTISNPNASLGFGEAETFLEATKPQPDGVKVVAGTCEEGEYAAYPSLPGMFVTVGPDRASHARRPFCHWHKTLLMASVLWQYFACFTLSCTLESECKPVKQLNFPLEAECKLVKQLGVDCHTLDLRQFIPGLVSHPLRPFLFFSDNPFDLAL